MTATRLVRVADVIGEVGWRRRGLLVQNWLMATGSLTMKFRWQSTGLHSADRQTIQPS
jgi:hypothetical protein